MLGIMIICAVIVLVAVGALKVVPTYLEFRNIRSAAISARDGGKTVNEIQRAFDRAATINDITTISGKDLEVTKEGNTVIVTFRYEKKVHLFYNVSLVIEYAGSTEP